MAENSINKYSEYISQIAKSDPELLPEYIQLLNWQIITRWLVMRYPELNRSAAEPWWIEGLTNKWRVYDLANNTKYDKYRFSITFEIESILVSVSEAFNCREEIYFKHTDPDIVEKVIKYIDWLMDDSIDGGVEYSIQTV